MHTRTHKTYKEECFLLNCICLISKDSPILIPTSCFPSYSYSPCDFARCSHFTSDTAFSYLLCGFACCAPFISYALSLGYNFRQLKSTFDGVDSENSTSISGSILSGEELVYVQFYEVYMPSLMYL